MPRKNGKVLILSPHVMTAALVGWYVELAKLEPAFAAPGENPSDALARVKPLLVVLIDAASEDAISDLFAARASKAPASMTPSSCAAMSPIKYEPVSHSVVDGYPSTEFTRPVAGW